MFDSRAFVRILVMTFYHSMGLFSTPDDTIGFFIYSRDGLPYGVYCRLF